MKIAGYLPTSLIEWPGKIAAVVFVPGCNFRCPFCHNRDLVLASDDSPDLPDIPEKEVFASLKKRKKCIDGVVVSGGEPILQTDLNRFLNRCKQMGFETMIETNGSRPEIIEKLIKEKLIDYIAIDIKATLDKNYQDIVQAKSEKRKAKSHSSKLKTLENIKKSIRLILKSSINFEFRTTVVPTLHTKKEMVKLAHQLKELTLNTKYQILNTNFWFLQNFRPKNCLDPKFNQIKPYSPKEMKEILAGVREYVPGAGLRGA